MKKALIIVFITTGIITQSSNALDSFHCFNHVAFTTTSIPGDFELDGDVDLRDFAVLALAWLSEPGNITWNPACDISDPNDNIIDSIDLVVFTEHWLNIAPDRDYTGIYSCEFQGDDNFAGYINIEQTGNEVTAFFSWECPSYAGSVSGNDITLIIGTTAVTGRIDLSFSEDGQSFSGTWEVQGDSNILTGTITGTKVEDEEWPGAPCYDLDPNNIPKFVENDFTELSKMSRISKFRSGIGHDYSDDFEFCRNMKHYYEPKEGIDWEQIKKFAPVSGTITQMFDEWVGTQIWIQPAEYIGFEFRIFHVNIDPPLNVGDSVVAGQQIGTHVGSQSILDIAVNVNTPTGQRLISYFDVMTDSLFQSYQLRGMTNREDAIISEAERDADSLECDGEEIVDSGNLENWVVLTD